MTGGSKERIRQALTALEALGLPREQRNERSALALLALLGITRRKGWADATSPLLGVTPIMAFAHREYGAKYAPNTRETFRRFTLHQFVEAGLVVANPDKPDRPTNSPKYCYQIDPDALKLLRRVGKRGWTHALRAYLAKHATLASTYAQQREMLRIPVFATAGGRAIKLTPGGQSPLIRAVVDEFCQRFTPGASILYIGDTGRKWAHFAQADLAALGVVVETHRKMPDVVVHYADKNWLVLIEAVTSHGPVNPKRLNELKRLFRGSNAGLVFVTAFSDRPAFMKYLSDIAWETEVWVASSPDHMIHFNGERFLGPY